MIVGQDIVREIRGHGKIKEITEIQVFRPLVVGPKICERTFHLNHHEPPVTVECGNVDAAPTGQLKLGQRGIPQIAHQADDTSGDIISGAAGQRSLADAHV